MTGNMEPTTLMSISAVPSPSGAVVRCSCAHEANAPGTAGASTSLLATILTLALGFASMRFCRPPSASTASAAEATSPAAQIQRRVVLALNDRHAVTLPASRARWAHGGLADRLGEQILRELIADRRAGATNRELVERYGISMSSVKRILRRESEGQGGAQP
jgi:hypothetical protein